MPRARSLRVAIGSILVAALCAACSGKAECTAEIAEGGATFKGAAAGKKGQARLDRDALLDACRQRCAASKAEMPDACASRCAADVEGGKLPAKTRCTDR